MVISGNDIIVNWTTIVNGDTSLEANVAPYNKGFKNYIINGGFDVWQRGTSQTNSGYDSDDRWYNGNSGSTKTHSKVACTDTERAFFNASYFSRTVVSSVAGSENTVTKAQKIEDITRLAGKTVTVSFWAKADSTKKIWIEHKQNFGTGGTPTAEINAQNVQEFTLSSTWTKYSYTMTVPSIVGKTLGTDGVHTSHTQIQIWFDVGSSYLSRIPTGVQQSGTFDIAQVQLEEGSVATPFEQRPYGLELSLCQRYYQRFSFNSSSNAQPVFIGGFYNSTTQLVAMKPLLTTMRIAPSVSYSNLSHFDLEPFDEDISTKTISFYSREDVITIDVSGVTARTIGFTGTISLDVVGSWVGADAEL